MSKVKSKDIQMCKTCNKLIQPKIEHIYWQMNSYCKEKCMEAGRNLLNVERDMANQLDHAGDAHA